MNKIQNSKLSLIFLAIIALAVGIILFVAPEASAQVDLNTPPNQTEQYNGGLSDNPVFKWIQFFINVLTVVIIAGAAVMYAVAGVRYTSARDNTQTTQAAKDQIFNTTLGLVAYFFLYGFVQWLIPGGVF